MLRGQLPGQLQVQSQAGGRPKASVVVVVVVMAVAVVWEPGEVDGESLVGMVLVGTGETMDECQGGVSKMAEELEMV